MYPIDPIYTAGMNDQQRGWFYAEYERARKDEVVGVLFALFLGSFGVHHFYLRRDGLGVLYLLFFWTGIPALLGFIECFFMPGRVRQYNAMQAVYISSQILGGSPIPGTPPGPAVGAWTPAARPAVYCHSCNNPLDSTATFCTRCGTAVNQTQLSTQPVL
jgi:TM2 domain-containing membrane protein YozV